MQNKLYLKVAIFILPSLLLAIFIIADPIIDLVKLSFSNVGTFGDIKGFAGFDNYSDMLDDPLFFDVVIRTIIWTIFVVGGTLLISIPVAIILSEKFAGRALVRVIIMLPWSVSLPMTAVMWKWLLNDQYGMLNKLLIDTNIINENIGWLASGTTAFSMQILIGILVSIPFTVSVLMGGLTSIPQDIYDAAKLDGSNYLTAVKNMTLPLLKPFISIAIVLNIIYVFNSFPIIWVLTEGGPANATDILPTYLYKLAFQFGEIGLAAAVSIFMLVVLLLITSIYAYMVMSKEQ